MSSNSIDLVKGNTNIFDELIKWALSFGRLLIIIVEIVAFSAFIYRFALDRQIVDLGDKIKQEQAIVESIKTRENIYRGLQERLLTTSAVTSTGNNNLKFMNDIVAFTPDTITYNSFGIGEGKLQLEINVNSITSLTSFINSLKNYPAVESVTVTSIDNDSAANSVKVNITAKIKESSK
jgi:hypothetical protein